METLDADLVRLGTRTGRRRARAPPTDGSSCRIPQSTRRLRRALTATTARIDAAVIRDSGPALHASRRQERSLSTGHRRRRALGGNRGARDRQGGARAHRCLRACGASTTIVTRDELESNGLHVRFPMVVEPVLTQTARREGLARARGRPPRDQFFGASGGGGSAPERRLVAPGVHPRGLGALGGVAWTGPVLCSVHQVAHRVRPTLGGSSYCGHRGTRRLSRPRCRAPVERAWMEWPFPSAVHPPGDPQLRDRSESANVRIACSRDSRPRHFARRLGRPLLGRTPSGRIQGGALVSARAKGHPGAHQRARTRGLGLRARRTAPKTRNGECDRSHRPKLIPLAECRRHQTANLLRQCTRLPTVTPSRSLTTSWSRFALAVQPDTRISLLRQGGVRPSSRPHDSPQTSQTTHLPKDSAAQPGAERADVIPSEPV
jgi:hypothetical protein